MDSFQMLSTRTVEDDIETEIISSEDMAEMQVDHTALVGQLGTADNVQVQQEVRLDIPHDNMRSPRSDCRGTGVFDKPNGDEAQSDSQNAILTVTVKTRVDAGTSKVTCTVPEEYLPRKPREDSCSIVDCCLQLPDCSTSEPTLPLNLTEQTNAPSAEETILSFVAPVPAVATTGQQLPHVSTFILPAFSNYGSCPTLNLEELLACLQKSPSAFRRSYRRPPQARDGKGLRPIRCAKTVKVSLASSSIISQGPRSIVSKLPIPADPLRTTFSYPLYPPQPLDVNVPEADFTENSLPNEDNANVVLEKPPQKPRTCRCSKSNCLKLYCDCFSLGEVCGGGCSCQNCFNNERFPDERTEAANTILKRNAKAFKRVGTGGCILVGGKERTGCRCRKSECLKNYCECFVANERCGDSCTCRECKNTVSHPLRPSRRRRTRRKKSIQHTESASKPQEKKTSVILDSILRQRVSVASVQGSSPDRV